MKLGYIIIYVPDPAAACAFYERAFGIATGFMHDSGDYAEMNTGAVTLAFVSEALRDANGTRAADNRPDVLPAGAEIAFVADDPEAGYERALAAGAAPYHAPEAKPWGQTVAYVRDLNGFLVEICSPVGS